VDRPPVIEQLDVGSYNLFGAHREESAVRWSRLHKRRAKGISPAPGAEHTKGVQSSLRLRLRQQRNDTT
jgi:hypothetical protein